METQISNLRSGKKNQILNPQIDYTQFPKSSTHNAHSGSNYKDVMEVWGKVTKENPTSMEAIVKGIKVDLIANWSVSGKSVSYTGNISKETLEEVFGLKSSEKNEPYISIQDANDIVVSNGKNSLKYICPSLIKIL